MIPVARIELLDEVQLDAVNRYSKLNCVLKPTLFFEFHGTSQAAVAESATAVQEIAAENGGRDFQWATTTEERAKLWTARHNAFYAAVALPPGCKPWTTDVCVPISRLAECVLETQRRRRQGPGLLAPLVGHVGDGNFHLIFPDGRRTTRPSCRRRKQINARLIARALAMGGTVQRRAWRRRRQDGRICEAEHGESLEVMKAIKRALDPDNRMNPGKMISEIVD